MKAALATVPSQPSAKEPKAAFSENLAAVQHDAHTLRTPKHRSHLRTFEILLTSSEREPIEWGMC